MKIVKDIQEELKRNIDLKYQKEATRFFKEEIKFYGVKYPIIRKIAKEFFKKIEPKTKENISKLSEELLSSGFQEAKVVAFQWVLKLKKEFAKEDFYLFEKWLNKYINNWANCDDFCNSALGEILFQYPELIEKTFLWTNSKNKWKRRASAVSLIYVIRRKNILKNIFKVADKLLIDKEDLVQKGYGWMLKETSNIYPKEVFYYVMKNKSKMPRTALRYAIEKFPKDLKIKAMK